MNRNIWLSLFLLIAASLSTLWMWHHSHRQLPPPASTLDQRPDAFMLDVNYDEYDEQGQLHSHLSTPKTVHYPHQNSMTFEQPNFMIYTDEHIPWYISSLQGNSQDGIQTIHLWNNVVIHQPAEPNPL